MGGLIYNLDEDGTAICALLYHPRRPCANPGGGGKMNKQTANGIRAKPWLTD
jgi:hypothetical protein